MTALYLMMEATTHMVETLFQVQASHFNIYLEFFVALLKNYPEICSLSRNLLWEHNPHIP